MCSPTDSFRKHWQIHTSALSDSKRPHPSTQLRCQAMVILVHQQLDGFVPITRDNFSSPLDDRQQDSNTPTLSLVNANYATACSVINHLKTVVMPPLTSFLAKFNTVGIGQNLLDKFSLPTQQLTAILRLKLSVILVTPSPPRYFTLLF